MADKPKKKRYRYAPAIRHMAAHYIMTKSGRVAMTEADLRATVSYIGQHERLPDSMFRHPSEINKHVITALGVISEKV